MSNIVNKVVVQDREEANPIIKEDVPVTNELADYILLALTVNEVVNAKIKADSNKVTNGVNVLALNVIVSIDPKV